MISSGNDFTTSFPDADFLFSYIRSVCYAFLCQIEHRDFLIFCVLLFIALVVLALRLAWMDE